jgi:hypothetical protein
MEKIIKAGAKTPEVKVNSEKGQIILKGVIIPENPLIFFGELNEYIDLCFKDSNSLILDLDLEYFNTGAARYLYDIFKKLKLRTNISVFWQYESDDEDIYESGLEFQELSGLKFEFVVK